MFESFFASRKYFWKARGRGALLLALIVLNVSLSAVLTHEMGVFGDLLQKAHEYTLADFNKQALFIIVLRFGYLAVDPFTTYHTQMFCVDWREAITYDLIPKWKKIIGKAKIEGVSQRLQDEPYRFTLFLESFGTQILRAIMALIAFIPMLWVLSPIMRVEPSWLLVFIFAVCFVAGVFISWLFWFRLSSFGGQILRVAAALGFLCATSWALNFSVHTGRIHGVLVFLVFGCSIAGVFFSWLFGRHLPDLVNTNRAREVEFRDELVLIEEDKSPYNILLLETQFQFVYKSYKNLFWKFIPFNIWTTAYGQITSLIPLWLTGNWVFLHITTYGSIPKVTMAFMEAIGALSVFTNNWRNIIDFTVTYRRLSEFNTVCEEGEESAAVSDFISKLAKQKAEN
jgi:peptide/bleomycin uptake transporter